MSLEVAQINPRNPVIGVIVHKEPAAIVFRFSLREGRVMHIAPGKIAQHLSRLVIEAITRRRVRREDRDGADMPHRWDAGDKDLPGMSAGIEEIILILFARRDVTRERISGALGQGGAALFSTASHCNCNDDGEQISADAFHSGSFLSFTSQS